MTEPIKEESNLTKAPKSPKRGVWRFIRKTVLWLMMIFFALNVLILLLSQTHFFRSWVSDNVLSIVNESINGEVMVDDLVINPFADIVIRGLQVHTEGDTLAYIDKILIDLSIWDLLSEKANVNKIFIGDLKANLIMKEGDSLWNFQKLVPPSEDTTEAGEPPGWIIDLYNLQIANAEIKMINYNDPYKKTDSIDFETLHINDFDLSLSAYAKLNENKFNVEIHQLAFREEFSGYEIEQLSLEVAIDTLSAKITDLKLQTPNTDFAINAHFKRVNFFGDNLDYELFHSPIEVSLEAEKIDMYEMKNVVPIPLLFSINPKLSFKASGHLDSISIDDIDMELNQSKINLEGSFSGLYQGDNLVYDITFKETKIQDNDVQNLIPELNLKSIPNFGKANLSGTRVVGSSDSAYADLRVATGIGDLVGEAGIRWQPEFIYTADIRSDNLNLGALARSGSLSGTVNTSLRVNGSSFDPKFMSTEIILSGTNSNFTGYRLKKYDIFARIDSGMIMLDTCRIVLLDQKDSAEIDEFAQEQVVSVLAMLDIREEAKPNYTFSVETQAVNMNDLFDISGAPEYIDFSMQGEFEGFEPDSIQGKLSGRVGNCFLEDRSIMPFDMYLNIDREGSSKDIALKSDILDLELSGDFIFNDLIYLATSEAELIVSHIDTRLAILEQNSEQDKKQTNIYQMVDSSKINPMNISIKSSIKDFSFVNPFLRDMTLDLKANIDITLDVDSERSNLVIDSLNIINFDITSDSLNLSVENLLMEAETAIDIKDSAIYLDRAYCHISQSDKVILDDLIISKPEAYISYDGEAIDFETSGGYGNIVDHNSGGKISFSDSFYQVVFDKLSIGANKNAIWKNQSDVVIDFKPGEIFIQKFLLQRGEAESISLSGGFLGDKIDKFNLTIRNLRIDEINKIPMLKKKLEKLQPEGNIESLSLLADGSFVNTKIDLALKASQLKLNQVLLGDLEVNLQHINSNILGDLEIHNPQLQNEDKTLDIRINSLPMNLSISAEGERLKNKEMDITISSRKMPLEIVRPFATGVTDLSGYADISLDLNGVLPDNLDYKGNIDILKSSFLVDATNMKYLAQGKIDITKDKISWEKLKLYNEAKDLNNGLAYVDGTIELQEFELSYFDFVIESDGFQVLSNATAKTMPQLYGTLVIATDTKPLRFFGTLDEPYMHGSVNILDGKLQMPEIKRTNVAQSSFIYEYIGADTLRLVAVQDTSAIESSGKENEKNIADLIDYNLDLKIKKTIDLTMEMGSLGQLVAQIGLPNTSETLHFEMKPGEDPQVRGPEIQVKRGSSLKFVYFFDTEGEIFFPSGSVSNPGLNLTAKYKGVTDNNGVSIPWEVLMKIKGTKESPLYELTYTRNGVEATGDTAKIREDAISLLLFGVTKAELEMSGGGDYLSGTAVSALSSILSKSLTSAFQGTGVIQSADIDFNDSDNFSNATIRLTGRLMGDARWKVGGSMADFMQNNEVTVELPLELGLELWGMNQTSIEFTRSINNATNINKDQKDWEFRINFGGSR
jgi:hypothetical protein